MYLGERRKRSQRLPGVAGRRLPRSSPMQGIHAWQGPRACWDARLSQVSFPRFSALAAHSVRVRNVRPLVVLRIIPPLRERQMHRNLASPVLAPSLPSALGLLLALVRALASERRLRRRVHELQDDLAKAIKERLAERTGRIRAQKVTAVRKSCQCTQRT